MAQKTEKKEETEFKVPETIPTKTIVVPCVNNCGLTATAANNMCPNCFAAATTSSSAGTSPQPSRSAHPRKRPFPEEENPSVAAAAAAHEDPSPQHEEAAPSEAKRAVNRCSGCRRRVGLTGFRCRCGELFCAEHRYSDRHDCSFDYKAAGREAIARENPVIRAPKIVKV